MCAILCSLELPGLLYQQRKKPILFFLPFLIFALAGLCPAEDNYSIKNENMESALEEESSFSSPELSLLKELQEARAECKGDPRTIAKNSYAGGAVEGLVKGIGKGVRTFFTDCLYIDERDAEYNLRKECGEDIAELYPTAIQENTACRKLYESLSSKGLEGLEARIKKNHAFSAKVELFKIVLQKGKDGYGHYITEEEKKLYRICKANGSSKTLKKEEVISVHSITKQTIMYKYGDDIIDRSVLEGVSAKACEDVEKGITDKEFIYRNWNALIDNAKKKMEKVLKASKVDSAIASRVANEYIVYTTEFFKYYLEAKHETFDEMEWLEREGPEERRESQRDSIQ